MPCKADLVALGLNGFSTRAWLKQPGLACWSGVARNLFHVPWQAKELWLPVTVVWLVHSSASHTSALCYNSPAFLHCTGICIGIVSICTALGLVASLDLDPDIRASESAKGTAGETAVSLDCCALASGK